MDVEVSKPTDDSYGRLANVLEQLDTFGKEQLDEVRTKINELYPELGVDDESGSDDNNQLLENANIVTTSINKSLEDIKKERTNTDTFTENKSNIPSGGKRRSRRKSRRRSRKSRKSKKSKRKSHRRRTHRKTKK